MNLAVEKSIGSVAEKPQEKSRHLGWLDQIRGAAALYVVCHHAVMQVTVIGHHANDPIYRMLQLLTSYGHYAVDVFIVLSGYCLMLPVVANQKFGNIWTFYLRRTVRIVLPYYGALLVTLAMIYLWIGEADGSHWAGIALPVTTDSLLKHLLLIHQWLPEVANKINPAFWSVGVEYQIYFLFPFFYFIAKKIGFIPSFLVITFISYALWGVSYSLNVLNPSSTGTSFYYCALFFMGMSAAQFSTQAKELPTHRWFVMIDRQATKIAIASVIGMVLLATTAFLISRFAPSVFFPLQIQSFFVGLFFSLLLYLKGKNKVSSFEIRDGAFFKFLGWVGTIGFSVYLLHDPVIAIVWSYVVEPMNLTRYWMQAIVELAVGISASIGLAAMFYTYVELPCHQLSKSIKK